MFNATETGTILDAINNGIAVFQRGIAFRISDSDRDDIRQNAFLKVCTGYNPVRGMLSQASGSDISDTHNGTTHTNSSLGAFAYRVAQNVAVDFMRGRKGSRLDGRFVSTEATMGDDGDTFGSILPDHTPNPRDLLAMKRRQIAADAALASLSDDERQSMLSDDERPATGAERIRKMRAIGKIQETVKAAL